MRPEIEILDTRGCGNVGAAIWTFLGAIRRLVAMRLAGELDMIHANISVRGSTVRKWVVGRLARVLGVPYILHLHGSQYREFHAGLPGFLQGAVRDLFGRAARVVVLGQAWADWVHGTLGIPRDRIAILHNGVHVEGAGVPPPAHDGPCHIVLLGRIGRRKGVPELLAALGSPAMRCRPWRATLAGDGDVDAYRAEAAAAGLADRVAFPGWIDAPAAAGLMRDADILTLPSHAENFPISVIEALAHGVAVVTTPVGATPELLADGKSALFVPVGDAAALAGALACLVDDPIRRRAIGTAGHEIFRRELDINLLANRLAEIYDAARVGVP